MSATVTATGKAGPNITITAVVYANIASVKFDCINDILSLTDTSDKVTDIAITSATTITATKSGSTYTFTIS